MATLTFMTQTIFDHGASQQPGQVLAMHGIERGIRDGRHAAKDVCTFTNPRPCSVEEYEQLFEIALS